MWRPWLCVAVLGACGGSGSGDTTDAAVADGGDVDAADVDGSVLACGYTETQDLTNNNSPNAEVSMVSFSTVALLCGQVDTGHFTNGNVDVDAFKFTVAASSDVLMHVTGTGIETLDRVVIQLATTAGTQLSIGTVVGDHGTLRATLPAGDYVAAVSAFHANAIGAPVPYQLKIVTDQPSTRCVKGSGTVSYAEANDGAANTGNDMIRYDEAAMPQRSLTPSGADVPEPAGAGATIFEVTGSAANVNPTDSYMDRDTFEFTTGATTNQLSVRLNWVSTTADFDFLLFHRNTANSFAGALVVASGEDEFDTFAVQPDTKYWLWIGAYDGSTGLPAAYAATICNETFTP